jgi:hypothetical protein
VKNGIGLFHNVSGRVTPGSKVRLEGVAQKTLLRTLRLDGKDSAFTELSIYGSLAHAAKLKFPSYHYAYFGRLPFGASSLPHLGQFMCALLAQLKQ